MDFGFGPIWAENLLILNRVNAIYKPSMRHLMHQINNKTTPFIIYILTFVSIWVFIKLLVLRVVVCRKSDKIDKNGGHLYT